ncbi:MAG TPA: FAD-dependent oxidoreductase [Acidimicrobiia bacterium]|nr:FAD-dependent oxidoreductase [Acidimicrobiia bacterium]
MSVDYDLVVVGGGAGGISAARAGVRRGAKTLLVHHGPIGGDCTFTGCVPSKALIEAAARGVSFEEAVESSRRAVDAIAATETPDVFRREGVEVMSGWARFRSRRRLDVDGRAVDARRVIVATGAGPAVPPIDGLAEIAYLTSDTVFELTSPPHSLAVLGGGAIGCELAQAFGRLGVQVTLIEALPRLIAREEPEASAAIEDALRADSVDVRTGAAVTRVERLEGEDGACLHLADGATALAEKVLVAVGRSADTTGLDLEAAGVETDARGFIRTDDHLATTARGIWAVGDIAGKSQFTHAAEQMGRIATANALTHYHRRRFRSELIPAVTYTSPEVGRVGMTEAEAAEHGGRVAYLPMTEFDRAVVAGETRGFVKLIAAPRPMLRNLAGGRIIGATAVAPRGGEMIHEAVLAMSTKMFPVRLALSAHAYPTWSVAMQQAAAQLFTEIGGRRAHPAGSEAGLAGLPRGDVDGVARTGA